MDQRRRTPTVTIDPAACGCGLPHPIGAGQIEPFLTTPSGWQAGPLPRRPLLLDAFCKQGGASVGYHLAGFDVVGVDYHPQPAYPFPFVQADALAFIASHGHRFDAIHASPPCQAFSPARVLHGRVHPRLLAATRRALEATGRPYVLENVEGASSELRHSLMLCGSMWGRLWYRHRLFESNLALLAPPHPAHDWPQARLGRPAGPGQMLAIIGHFPQVDLVRRQMEMAWATRDGIAQAVPPVFCDYLGRQLLARLYDDHAAALAIWWSARTDDRWEGDDGYHRPGPPRP
jgi:DNA (cytosine-5)-methyltransferase 1